MAEHSRLLLTRAGPSPRERHVLGGAKSSGDLAANARAIFARNPNLQSIELVEPDAPTVVIGTVTRADVTEAPHALGESSQGPHDDPNPTPVSDRE